MQNLDLDCNNNLKKKHTLQQAVASIQFKLAPLKRQELKHHICKSQFSFFWAIVYYAKQLLQ